MLNPRRLGGDRLGEGKRCPPDVTIGTGGSAISVLDAGTIGKWALVLVWNWQPPRTQKAQGAV